MNNIISRAIEERTPFHVFAACDCFFLVSSLLMVVLPIFFTMLIDKLGIPETSLNLPGWFGPALNSLGLLEFLLFAFMFLSGTMDLVVPMVEKNAKMGVFRSSLALVVSIVWIGGMTYGGILFLGVLL